jgi:hypothetical protein
MTNFFYAIKNVRHPEERRGNAAMRLEGRLVFVRQLPYTLLRRLRGRGKPPVSAKAM